MALGEVAKQFLDQAFGIRTVAHVVALGGVQTNPDLPLPTPDDLEALDASPVRTLDKEAEARIIERINEAKKASDTLGGVIEVLAYGVPAGIGTYVESDRDWTRLWPPRSWAFRRSRVWRSATASWNASRPGSQAHDEIVVNADGRIDRLSNRAGGIEAVCPMAR